MKTVHSKYIIVGAGLSGLVTAYTLSCNGNNDFILLEARNKIGGRIHTKDGVDLGATWFQEHHSLLQSLMNELEVKKFKQYNTGKSVLVYNTMAPAHYFKSEENESSANRIVGGSIALIESLSKTIEDRIYCNTMVKNIHEVDEKLILTTENKKFIAEKVIIAIPPKLALHIQFNPELPKRLYNVMKQTHTWMSNAIKVGIVYKTPFWRENDFSGTVIGQVGPVIELYDHCDSKNERYSLMGFINEGLRDTNVGDRKERILSYLEKYLGKEVRDYVDYFEKDWSEDRFTACKNLKSVYMSPKYGNAMYNTFYLNHKLLFSGTETSPVYGGYLEGAVYSGIRAAKKLLNN